jgi:putative aldouronate transport system permease protein
MILRKEDYPLTVYIRRTIEDTVKQMEDDSTIMQQYDFSTYSLRYAFIVCSIIPIVVIYPKLQKYFAACVNVGGVKE